MGNLRSNYGQRRSATGRGYSDQGHGYGLAGHDLDLGLVRPADRPVLARRDAGTFTVFSPIFTVATLK